MIALGAAAAQVQSPCANLISVPVGQRKRQYGLGVTSESAKNTAARASTNGAGSPEEEGGEEFVIHQLKAHASHISIIIASHTASRRYSSHFTAEAGDIYLRNGSLFRSSCNEPSGHIHEQ